MRFILKLIAHIILIMTLVAVTFAFNQSRHEERRLHAELERGAIWTMDSLRGQAEPILRSGSTESLKQVAARFSRWERIMGVSFHDVRGNLLAASPEIDWLIQKEPGLLSGAIQEVERRREPFFGSLSKGSLYGHSVLIIENDVPSYVMTILYDTAFIRERVWRIWVNAFWRVLVQILLISLATLLAVYLNVMRPIRRTTEWIRKVRIGESSSSELERKNVELFGGLAKEISKMAKSLEMARLSAEEEARLRYSQEALWTADKLKEIVRAKLGQRSLIVVSNREPYMHLRKGKVVQCIVPASGLVTAIEPVLKSCGGLWIAQGSGDADRETVDSNDRLRVPPDDPSYTLRRVWVSPEEEKGFYYGFSNEGFWPLCHIAHTRPIFRPEDWQSYRAINERFADAVERECRGLDEPCILVQDYHLALLPRMIKERRPDARVSIFWHIPWPNPESFGICPWRKELLDGMLGADIIGFHTQFHCNNFMETVDRFLESRIDYEHFTIHRKKQTTWIKPYPISIDFANGAGKGPSGTSAADLLKPYGIQASWMGVGVDRLDYTKGIIERFRALDHFFDRYPDFKQKLTFVELGAPTRTGIEQYSNFLHEVEREVERVNTKHGNKQWKPILFLQKHHSHEEIRPFYQAADFCFVSSLHDGMNLVSKEYVAARDREDGVLILSQFTGAARDLPDALIVNPYDVSQMAKAVHDALLMSSEEQQKRMSRMRQSVKERNIYRWAADLVGDLAQVRMPEKEIK